MAQSLQLLLVFIIDMQGGPLFTRYPSPIHHRGQRKIELFLMTLSESYLNRTRVMNIIVMLGLLYGASGRENACHEHCLCQMGMLNTCQIWGAGRGM